MIDLNDVGLQVRETRQALKMTQIELAEKARVNRNTVNYLENGRAPDIGFKSIVRILVAIGLDLRVTTLNRNRPTLDDLRAEEAAEEKMRTTP